MAERPQEDTPAQNLRVIKRCCRRFSQGGELTEGGGSLCQPDGESETVRVRVLQPTDCEDPHLTVSCQGCRKYDPFEAQVYPAGKGFFVEILCPTKE